MFIKLTEIELTPNEKGEKRLEKVTKDFTHEVESKRSDEYGRTSEWYVEMNLPVPEDFKNQPKVETKDFTFEEDEIDRKENPYLCNLSKVVDIVVSNMGSTIYFDMGEVRHVKETIEQIYKLVQTK